MRYVIRINELGYFGKTPYTPVPISEAIVFDTMKLARKQENRLNGRLMKGNNATIEIFRESKAQKK